MPQNNSDRVEYLDYAERWKRDAMAICPRADSYFSIEVDASNILAKVEQLKSTGLVRASLIHFVTHAVAEVLSHNSKLHQLITSDRRILPVKVEFI